jgi:hypothetical protein
MRDRVALRGLIHCKIAVYGSRRDQSKKNQLVQCKRAATINGKSDVRRMSSKAYEKCQLLINAHRVTNRALANQISFNISGHG